jgi:two-component system cell cycle sensor histidine kinase/response regulator CckA
MHKKTDEEWLAEVQELRTQLEEAQETLNAIRRGEVDGLVVSTPKGEQVYTISGAERPYRALIEDMREGAVMLSDDNTVLYCNSGFARMMKSSIEKIVGLNTESMVCPTHLLALRKLLTLARAQKSPVTKEITLQANGNILVPTLMSINSFQSDTLNNTFLVVTDLTEHMEEEVKSYTTELELAQIALSESEQRWATTLSSIGDAVISTDMFGKIKFMNGVAEKLTLWTLNDAQGKDVKDIFRIINAFSRKTVDDPVFKVLKEGLIVGLANHTLLVRKDGTEIPIDDSGAPIKDKEGEISGVVLIFRDITVRRKMEVELADYRKQLENLVEQRTKQLKDAERMAAIGQTAGMVGHDIRNPLQAIVGDLYLAKEELKGIPDVQGRKSMQECIDEIEKNVDYINKIVADLQDFARPLKPNIETVDLKSIIDDLLSKNLVPDSIKLIVNLDDKAGELEADSSFINRIMANLVTNAVQAMPKGGRLTINAFKESKDIIIKVNDTGVGVPESIKGKLFTPMFTTKARGQGFGLAVIKRMTEALGGTVTFESQEGKGTTFFIRFPPPMPKT